MLRRRLSVTRISLALFALTLATIPAALAKKKPPAHPININTAGATELQQVPGMALPPRKKSWTPGNPTAPSKPSTISSRSKASAPKN